MVDLSNHATEELALQAAKQYVAEEGGMIEFDGSTCDEEAQCMGWDGEDRRCDCGNNRVYWSTWKNLDGLWSAYATRD